MTEPNILANPIPLELATGIEGLLEIGGSYFIEGLPQGWQSSLFNIPSTYVTGADFLTKGPTDGSSPVIFIAEIPARQPFMTQFSMNNVSSSPIHPFDVVVGLRDNFGRLTVFHPYRYPPETEARYTISALSVDVSPQPPGYFINANSDVFQITSDGNVISMLRQYGGQYHLIYSFVIPNDILWWKFYYDCFYHNNNIYTLRIRIDDVTVPVTTTNSTLIDNDGICIIRIVDTTHYGVTAHGIADSTLILSNEHIPQSVNIPVIIGNLYIKPSDRNCGTVAITGEVIQFISNGGNGGLFEASGGTILSTLQWQAPTSIGPVNFTYTVNTVTAVCQLQVVNKLTVNRVNSDGWYPDLAQGEQVQFTSTCPDAIFECVNFPTILTPSGLMIAPTDALNDVFGAKDCIVKVSGCGQTYFFKIHIQAMFPSLRFCGANPLKWVPPNIKDFLPNRLTMSGGTSEVHNRNKDGILVWSVEYQSLKQDAPINCSCPPSQSGCTAALESASRLDAFYNQVSTVKYFTVVDLHTEIVYKYVRLTSYTGEHTGLYRNDQARSLTMRQEGDVLFD